MLDHNTTDSQYLREIYSKLLVLESHLLGNGNEGLVTVVKDQEKWINEIRGALRFVQFFLFILSSGVIVMLLQRFGG